ncbi:hypothetical protein ASS88_01385 [Staphylococcus saprophyticus]|nr:hypothetical protein ASS88_01385 [Staphylococcus saprophyticus]
MNNTLLVAIGLLIVAVCSVGIASVISVPSVIIYLVGLVIWLIGIQIYYKVKCRISQIKQSQQ